MAVTKKSASTTKPKELKRENALLIESAWEVCNQVGGIYTVIRSKIPASRDRWGDNYCLIGPAVHRDRHAELDAIEDSDDLLARAVKRMTKEGYDVFYGRWLVTGRPKVILFNLVNELGNRTVNSKELLDNYGIQEKPEDDLLGQVIAFSKMTEIFINHLIEENQKEKLELFAHFHEWMAALPILPIRKNNLNIRTVFTTHATMLGRFLAMNDTSFYDNLPKYNWQQHATHFGILPIVQIERACAASADSFTTVSEVTGRECQYLLSKKPDHILPNGLNIKRFAAYHEVQVQHQNYKEVIHQFVMGHFFSSYSFNLDRTLYFFTSGRYEYHNKGYDLTLMALNKLNELMKADGSDITVVMFLITKRPTWSINPEVLESRAVMEELRLNTKAIEKQVGERLFMEAASSEDDYKLPDLNKLVDDYWRLRYRRTIQAWKSPRWPIIVTHNLHDPDRDDVLDFLRKHSLINSPEDKVKIVYHPDFVTSTNPLFGIDYNEFVRGCHLGIFPSYYEPWGYTPLESIASGVPTVTSDLSGFGDYVKKNMKVTFNNGVAVLNRDNHTMEKSADDLAKILFKFVRNTRRYRISQRQKAEDLSEKFDWSVLINEYLKAYKLALNNVRTVLKSTPAKTAAKAKPTTASRRKKTKT